MHVIKKIFRGFTLLLFVWFLSLLALVAALVMTFNTPTKLEKSLSESGVYSSFVDSALAEAKKASEKDKNSSDIPIDNPAIVAAANNAFTPMLLQNSTENILDGTYAWLQGKTKTPTFSVDLSAAKNTFAEGVGKAAAQRVAKLPACTSAQLNKLSTQEIDLFSVSCKPAGLNIKAEQAKLVKEIKTNKDFLGQPVVNASNLPKDKNGKTIFDQLAQLPKAYKWVNASPWLLALITLFTGVIAFFLHDTRRRGFRNIALAFGIIGTIMLIINSATAYGLTKASEPNGAISKAADSSFKQPIIAAVKSIHNSISQVYVWFAIGYLVIAIVVLLALRFIKPKKAGKETKVSESDPTPPIDDTPKQENVKPNPQPEVSKNEPKKDQNKKGKTK